MDTIIIETAINEFYLDKSSYDIIYNLFSEKRRKFSINNDYAIREVYLPENKFIKECCKKQFIKLNFMKI